LTTRLRLLADRRKRKSKDAAQFARSFFAGNRVWKNKLYLSLGNCGRGCIDIVNSAASTDRADIDSELRALLRAHKTSKGRAALFKKFRASVRNQGPDVRRQLSFGELFTVPRLHHDNGR
jgi:hypothetical protein